MNGFTVVALLALSGGACGGGDTRGGGAGSDGPDGGGSAPRIAVTTGAAPALIAFRSEASTEWQTPSSASPGRYEFDATGSYRVIVVCDHRAGAQVVEYARTLDDARVIDNECGTARAFPLHVRGQMLQSGEVYFGFAGRGQSNPPWSFDLAAEAGTFDFLAFFGSFDTGFDHVSIRRDVAIAADLDLGTIDVAQENTQALVPTRFTAANLTAEEELSADVLLTSGNTFADRFVFTHPEQAWQLTLVPDAALRATDSQSVTLSATSSDGTQQRARNLSRSMHGGDPTVITLMDPLGPTTFDTTADRLVVSWQALPAHDEVDVSRTSFSSDFSHFVIHDVLLSRSFVAATGATSATLDFTDVPGFLPAWGHDPALEQTIALDAIRGEFPDSSLSEVSLDMPAPSAIAARGDVDSAAVAARARRARSAGLRGAGGRAGVDAGLLMLGPERVPGVE